MLSLSLVLAWSLALEDAHVLCLIDQLGDEQFAVRARAQARLVRIAQSDRGHHFRPRLEAATRHLDPEVARRAAAVLEAFYDVRPTRYPVLPWIDMLPAGFADRQATIDCWLSRARGPAGWSYSPDWPDYRYATSLYARELLRKGMPRSEVRRLLDEMAAVEQDYRSRRGMALLTKE
ncbi:MAG TPA: hypothetical protein VFA26_20985 [Gemmataceae bacterium]|nr:hypothetical protein [Gemmataceae bacterium]